MSLVGPFNIPLGLDSTVLNSLCQSFDIYYFRDIYDLFYTAFSFKASANASSNVSSRLTTAKKGSLVVKSMPTAAV